MAQAIAGFRDWDKLEERSAQLTARGAELVTQDDPRFPPALKLIPYPPSVLYIKGTLTPADNLAVAIVGTRGASYYGLKVARRLAGALAARGVTVVSGLARGIDTAAHRGPWRSGRTLAVLGAAWTRSTRRRTSNSTRRSRSMGPWSASFPWARGPRPELPHPQPHHQRPGPGGGGDRSRSKSGTAITVRYALDQGRGRSSAGPRPHRLAHQYGAAPPHPGGGQAGPGRRGYPQELPALRRSPAVVRPRRHPGPGGGSPGIYPRRAGGPAAAAVGLGAAATGGTGPGRPPLRPGRALPLPSWNSRAW